MRLSVLDRSPIRSGGTAAQAIRETLALAEAADRVEEAEAYPYADAELEVVRQNRQRVVAGDPGRVRERLEGLAEACGVEELLLLTITRDARARLRSYELPAEAFDLRPRDSAP